MVLAKYTFDTCLSSVRGNNLKCGPPVVHLYEASGAEVRESIWVFGVAPWVSSIPTPNV